MGADRDPNKHLYVRFQWLALYSRRGPAWVLKHTLSLLGTLSRSTARTAQAALGGGLP